MYRTHLKAVIGLLITVAALASEGKPQVKGGEPAGAERCPDQKVYTGKYRNRLYGFSIIIPAGLQGYWNSARCAPVEKYGCVCAGSDHGRVIPLSDDAHIEAYVGYQMEFDWTAHDEEKHDIASLQQREGVEHVKVLSSQVVRLGNLKAREWVVGFTEKGRNVIATQVVALHKGVEYKLIFRTPAERYEKDRRKFAEVKASWKLIPRLE